MVAVKTLEKPRLLNPALLWQVHAPVDVFIHDVITHEQNSGPGCQTPDAGDGTEGDAGDRAEQDQGWAIPPCHWDCHLILFINEVIGVVCLEDLVVDNRMGSEWVAEPAQRMRR